MLTIARLFGKSPFAPLQRHLNSVECCVGLLPELFQLLLSGDALAIDQICSRISKLEHEADLTKHDIRNHLPKSLFLAIDRESFLDILSLQDQLADQAEVIAHTAAMRSFALPAPLIDPFRILCEKNLEAFCLVGKVIRELDELLESSFGGIEAAKVKQMVEQIAFLDHETDVLQRRLLKELYQRDDLPHPLFHLMIKLIEEIGALARLSEKLGNLVRMLLELK